MMKSEKENKGKNDDDDTKPKKGKVKSRVKILQFFKNNNVKNRWRN